MNRGLKLLSVINSGVRRATDLKKIDESFLFETGNYTFIQSSL